ncbi:MAG: GTPase Era [Calditrichaceae bacterium]|nr:GTPase Era [Calditrichaceae bacterium]
MQSIPKDFKAGYAAIIGLPNAGKSTLLNALLDIKLSIISAKPQTTRRRVLGILNKEKYQVVFIDTPGILKPRYELQKRMMQHVTEALADADIIILIIDAQSKNHPIHSENIDLIPKNKPIILLLNKIDLIEKKNLLTLIEIYNKKFPTRAIIPISALKQDGLDSIEAEIMKYLLVNPPYYPPGLLTEHPERFFVGELIREKIFEKFYQEVPYSTEVVIEDFKERSKGKDYIYAVILVERKSQKGILIGKGGETLKQIGEGARKEIEEFLGRKVFLELRVKVNENWRRDDLKLKQLGY